MIWLIGNQGMLGFDVEKMLKEADIPYLATDREVDITDFEKIKKFVAQKEISWLINCAAYTAVDKAEDDKEQAYKINGDGTKNLAEIAKDLNAILLHISTDYVFDGAKNGLYTENDICQPTGVYGSSKLAGEKNIKEKINKYFIIRTSWLYGKNGHNFVKTMLRLFQEKNQVHVVKDQQGCPTYTRDLATFVVSLVKGNENQYGIYHFSNTGPTSWFEFARKIYAEAYRLKLLNKKVELIPIKTDAYPTRAVRPKNSALSKDKVRKTFGIQIRNWQIALKDFLLEIKNEGK